MNAKERKQQEEGITKVRERIQWLLPNGYEHGLDYAEAFGMAYALYLLGIWKKPNTGDSEFSEIMHKEQNKLEGQSWTK